MADTTNIEMVTIYNNKGIKATLNYLSDEIRLYLYDTDGEYIDDWAFDIGQDISDFIKKLINGLDTVSIKDFFEKGFNRKVIENATIQQWIEAKAYYGEEYVNRVNNNLIIMIEY